jgi:hypothetical protein
MNGFLRATLGIERNRSKSAESQHEAAAKKVAHKKSTISAGSLDKNMLIIPDNSEIVSLHKKLASFSLSCDNELNNRKTSHSSDKSENSKMNFINQQQHQKSSLSSTSSTTESSTTRRSFSLLGLNKLGRRIVNSISFGKRRSGGSDGREGRAGRERKLSISMDSLTAHLQSSSPKSKTKREMVKSSSCRFYEGHTVPTIYVDSFENWEQLQEGGESAIQQLAVLSAKSMLSFAAPIIVSDKHCQFIIHTFFFTTSLLGLVSFNYANRSFKLLIIFS